MNTGTFSVYIRGKDEWEFVEKFPSREAAEDWARNQDCGYKICDPSGEPVEVATARVRAARSGAIAGGGPLSVHRLFGEGNL